MRRIISNRERVLIALLDQPAGRDRDALYAVSDYKGTFDMFEALLRNLERNSLIFCQGKRWFHGKYKPVPAQPEPPQQNQKTTAEAVKAIPKFPDKPKPPRIKIKNLQTKSRTLQKLAAITEASIAEVLIQIDNDLAAIGEQ